MKKRWFLHLLVYDNRNRETRLALNSDLNKPMSFAELIREMGTLLCKAIEWVAEREKDESKMDRNI